jgi:ABC-type multidrug transport system fused ATPase/permease subunit
MKNIINLFNLLSLKRKKQILLFLILTIVGAGCEIMSLAIFLPFLAILINPEAIISYGYLNQLARNFSVQGSALLLVMTCAFGGTAVLIGLIRLLLLWSANKIAFGVGADICLKIYSKALYTSYIKHLNTNSSKIISSISERSNIIIYNVVLPTLTLISSCVIFISLIITLLIIGKEVVFFGIIFFGLIYIVIIKSIKFLLVNYGKVVNLGVERQIKMLQEGLGGIRDVLLNGTQEVHIDLFKKNDTEVRNAQARIQFISQSPKYAIEALGLLMIAIFSYIFASNETNINNVVPVLGIIALGSQRLLPVMQQAYAGWAAITSGADSLNTTMQLLHESKEIVMNTNSSFRIKDEILLKNICFKYPGKEVNVLNLINLKIKCGEKIGIIGKTGSGKSTLLDIIMCLIDPDEGEIYIDNLSITANNSQGYKKNISHVPQNIYILDATIAENIALGEKNIDIYKVGEMAKLAELTELIAKLPNGLNEQIGENGNLLSGGERQRIGIARALYKNTSLIILDEATSALDNETERKVIENIEKNNSNKTIIMIAHRTSTLSSCDTIYEIVDGYLLQIK